MVYFETFPTVWYILELYHTVGTVSKYTTLLEQFEIYHTVGKVSKYTTPSEQFQNIPHCVF
jgi:hypothetical protein